MNLKRYVIQWIPASAVEKVINKHRSKIEHDGFSVWDYCQPEDLEVSLIEPTTRKALAAAKRVLPGDEFGEVHIYEQVQSRESDERGSWTEWNEVRHGVLNDGERAICWL